MKENTYFIYLATLKENNFLTVYSLSYSKIKN